MKLRKINLTNFRLHKAIEMNTNSNNIVIVGNNASGKTTIVESLYYCCFFTSFRIKKAEELIAFGEEVAGINIEFESRNKSHTLDTYFNKTNRNIIYDGQKGQKRLDMVGKIKVLLLTPNSDELVSSSPRVRRSFLDVYISQYHPQYRILLSEYQKLTKQRSACLKAKTIDMPTLEIITERYDELIEEIRSMRIEFIKRVSTLSSSIIKLLSRGEDNIDLEYKTLEKANLDKEIRYQKNLYGLQFDDFLINLNQMPAKTYASQGQERSIAIALILSQIELINSKFGEYPIVIIDDVHIELDSYRQAILFEILNEKVQSFFVSTNIENMPEKIKTQSIKYKLSKSNNATIINEL